MNARPSRRLLATAAAASSVALLLAACSKSATQQPSALPTTTASTAGAASTGTPSPSTSSAPAIQWAVGTPLISDGSDTVTIGGVPVKFPTTVTDAAWSPDGSRVAFIDGDGNVATARPDGSSLVLLAKPDKGSKLSDTAWRGGTVLYTEQTANGVRAIRQAVSGEKNHSTYDTYTFINGDQVEITDTSAPTGYVSADIFGTHGTVAYQHKGAKGPEIWFHATDSNERGGANPAKKSADGSWPALGPSGQLAFVGTGGQIEVMPSTALTAAASSPTHLAWTPDGKSIAYSTPTGIEEIPADKPGGTPTQLSDKPGVVSFLPAATDRVATFSGTDPSDLTGTSIALSQHRWATQKDVTAMPAGGGAHGPYGMSVTLIVADDPAAAQKELSWGGFYGPTLLVHKGDLDPRVTAEIKRVLGKPQPNISTSGFADVGTVSLVDPNGVIAKSADAAISALGYKPVRVTAPSPTVASAPPNHPVAVVDASDTAALAEAKAEGCKVLTVNGGALSSADASFLAGLLHNNLPTPIVTFDDPADTATSAALAKTSLMATRALGTTHSDYVAALARQLGNNKVTVIPADSPTDQLLTGLQVDDFTLAYRGGGTTIVTVDPAQGISPTLKAYLDQQSATIGEIDVVDTGSKPSSDTVQQLSTLISGPLGATSVRNLTADSLLPANQ